jgi:hypothetical protein
MIGWAIFGTAGAIICVAAYLRGNYLLGAGVGLVYVLITLGLLYLAARARTPAGRWSAPEASLVAALAILLGYVMAFPASLSPDLQHFIDKQAADRAARAELAAVFASDPAFKGLWVSSVHLKVINLTIHGPLPGWADLGRLQSRVAEECPTAGECVLQWEVTLPGKRPSRAN